MQNMYAVSMFVLSRLGRPQHFFRLPLVLPRAGPEVEPEPIQSEGPEPLTSRILFGWTLGGMKSIPQTCEGLSPLPLFFGVFSADPRVSFLHVLSLFLRGGSSLEIKCHNKNAPFSAELPYARQGLLSLESELDLRFDRHLPVRWISS